MAKYKVLCAGIPCAGKDGVYIFHPHGSEVELDGDPRLESMLKEGQIEKIDGRKGPRAGDTDEKG